MNNSLIQNSLADTVENIIQHGYLLEASVPEDKFNLSYRHFLRYFASLEKITEHELIIGANFTYGWMPTILNFKSDKIEHAARILNKAKSTTVRIDDNELLDLKALVNNSLVGTSKLLHFVNPEIYGIWDSRVYSFFTGRANYQDLHRAELFWSYLDICNTVIEHNTFDTIHNSYLARLGFNISRIRTVEQILFIGSKHIA